MNELNKQQRIGIFKQWTLPNDNYYEYSQRLQSSAGSSVSFKIDQDLINQAKAFICNIQSIRQSKLFYFNQMAQTQSSLQKIVQSIHSLSCSEQIGLQLIEVYFQQLSSLYLQLRQAKQLQAEIKGYFQNANLTNYNQQSASIQFNKNQQSVSAELEHFINSTEREVTVFFQSFLFISLRDNYSILQRQGLDFDFHKTKIEQLMSHQNLIHIHFLMLTILNNIQTTLTCFVQYIRSCEVQYLKFELVYDSLCLMHNQTKEMKDLILEVQAISLEIGLKYLYPQSRCIDIMNLFARISRIVVVMNTNIDVFDSNSINFNRINAQVSMKQFLYSKNVFMKELVKFKNTTQFWNNISNQCQLICHIYRRFFDTQAKVSIEYFNFKNVSKDLIQQSWSIKNSIQLINKNCSQIINHIIAIFQYQIDQFMKKIGIIFNSKTFTYDRVKEQSRFVIDFMNKLEMTQKQNKLAFLNHNSITMQNKLQSFNLMQNYYLPKYKKQQQYKQTQQQLFNSQSQQLIKILKSIKQSKMFLQYCLVLSPNLQCNSITTENKYRQRIKQIEIIHKKYKNRTQINQLPEHFTDLLYNLAQDYQYLSKKQTIINNHQQTIKQFETAIKSEKLLKKSKGADDVIELSLKLLQKMWFTIFNQSYKHLSLYSQSLCLSQMKETLMNIAQIISKNVSFFPDSVLLDMPFDHILIYFYRCFYGEVKQPLSVSEQIKVMNLPQLMVSIVSEFMMKGQIGMKMSNKINKLVKLALIENLCGRGQNKSEENCFKTMRLMCYLSLANDLTLKYSKQSNQNILFSLLSIQHKRSQICKKHNKQISKNTLQLKTNQLLIELLKQQPLSINLKNNRAPIITTLNLNLIVNDFITISQSTGILQQSLIHHRANELCLILDVVAKRGQYLPYENIVVKKKSAINWGIVVELQKAKNKLKLNRQAIQKVINMLIKEEPNQSIVKCLYKLRSIILQ